MQFVTSKKKKKRFKMFHVSEFHDKSNLTEGTELTFFKIKLNICQQEVRHRSNACSAYYFLYMRFCL
jgi:hypothetical protein